MNQVYALFLKGTCCFISLLSILSLPLQAQTTHPITNTEAESLKIFIENTAIWAPGDTILLTSPGEYTINGPIRITQSLTLLADPALASRPLITFRGTDSGFKPRANDLTLYFKGFEANGLTLDDKGDPQRSMLLSFGRTFEGGNVGNSSITFDDVWARGFVSGVELFYEQGLRYRAVTINNVVWHDFSAWAVDPRLNATERIEITNSTFYHIGGFFRNPYTSTPTRPAQYPQQIFIHRNTIYNVASGVAGADALIQINDPTDGQINFTFANNVVSTLSNPTAARPFRLSPTGGVFTFNHNVFHNLESERDKGTHNFAAVDSAQANVSATGTLTVDPAFADPATGDFTLPEHSPLRTASTTGGPVGDPRWTGAEDENPTEPGDEVLVSQIIVGTSDGRSRITIKGGYLKMVATVLPGDATDRTVTWSIDRPDLATLAQNGDLDAKASGVVRVTATANDGSGVSGYMDVPIINQAPITSITVRAEDDRTTLTPGETVQLSTTLTPQNPDNPNVIWSVSNPDIATISEAGLLTAVAPGTVTVRASAEENQFMYGTRQVTVQTLTSVGTAVAATAILYPNPTTGRLHIASPAEVSIKNVAGVLVFAGTVGRQGALDIAHLPPGAYLTTIRTGERVQVIRLLKQ